MLLSKMEPTPPFEQAVEQFKTFLTGQGWSSLIVWRHPADVVRRIGKDMVVRRRGSRSASAWARRYYEKGHIQGLGIALIAECEIMGAACATMFWTPDFEEAQQRLLPNQGLKMSVALPRTSGESVSWLGWWFARKRLEASPKALGYRDRSK